VNAICETTSRIQYTAYDYLVIICSSSSAYYGEIDQNPNRQLTYDEYRAEIVRIAIIIQRYRNFDARITAAILPSTNKRNKPLPNVCFHLLERIEAGFRDEFSWSFRSELEDLIALGVSLMSHESVRQHILRKFYTNSVNPYITRNSENRRAFPFLQPYSFLVLAFSLQDWNVVEEEDFGDDDFYVIEYGRQSLVALWQSIIDNGCIRQKEVEAEYFHRLLRISRFVKPDWDEVNIIINKENHDKALERARINCPEYVGFAERNGIPLEYEAWKIFPSFSSVVGAEDDGPPPLVDE
jgi:hypothetical protein